MYAPHDRDAPPEPLGSPFGAPSNPLGTLPETLPETLRDSRRQHPSTRTRFSKCPESFNTACNIKWRSKGLQVGFKVGSR